MARLTVEGIIREAEYRPPTREGASGIVGFSFSPEGSRDGIDLWAFDDTLAARHLFDRWTQAGAATGPHPGVAARLTVEPTAKQGRGRDGSPGSPYISWRLQECVDAETGERITGRAMPEGESPVRAVS